MPAWEQSNRPATYRLVDSSSFICTSSGQTAFFLFEFSVLVRNGRCICCSYAYCMHLCGRRGRTGLRAAARRPGNQQFSACAAYNMSAVLEGSGSQTLDIRVFNGAEALPFPCYDAVISCRHDPNVLRHEWFPAHRDR